MLTKLSLLILGFITLSGRVAAQSQLTGPFTLTVDLTQIKDIHGKLYLSYNDAATKVRYRDSADIGTLPVVFKGKLPEPEAARLYIAAPGSGRIIRKNEFGLYLQPGDITIVGKDSLSNSIVTGDSSQPDYSFLVRTQYEIERSYWALFRRWQTAISQKDSMTTHQLAAESDEAEKAANKTKDSLFKTFILANSHKTPVALYALTQYAGYPVDPSKVSPLLLQLPEAYQDLPMGKMLSNQIAIAQKTAIGQYAPDFTQPDTLGAPVTLSSFRGKYVLLDFWASWCGPCRMENPNVIKAYQQYREKGFTVISVSLDRPGDRDKWLKAIHDDQMTWTHVSDLQYFGNAVAKSYDVQSIPQNFLLDKEGKIIAKNLVGGELAAYLATMLK